MIFQLFAALPLLAASAHLSLEEAHKTISLEVDSYRTALPGKSLCDQYSCCNATGSVGCDLDTLPKDESTLLLPGGETRCIYSTSTPFAFQVIPGATDKLLFYFQGGGACWDEASTKAGFCTSDSSPQGMSGVFDRSDSTNEYRDYTVVNVLYCSGDVHGGNVVQPYDDKEGVPVEQKGLANGQAALDWAKNQQTGGQLSADLSDLVIMGCSAGSIGAQLWGDQVARALSWSKGSIVPDSYAGVFPPGTMGPLIKSYGFCSSGFISPALLEKCNNGELTLQDINQEFMVEAPSLPYAFIQSKTDSVQISFYLAIGATTHSDVLITPSEFYNEVNGIFETYNKHANFVSYLVDGSQHCFTPSSVYYKADAMGPKDEGETNSGPMMSDWAGSLPLANGESINSVCEGTQQATSPDSDGNTYCDETLLPKAFTEQY